MPLFKGSPLLQPSLGLLDTPPKLLQKPVWATVGLPLPVLRFFNISGEGNVYKAPAGTSCREHRMWRDSPTSNPRVCLL